MESEPPSPLPSTSKTEQPDTCILQSINTVCELEIENFPDSASDMSEGEPDDIEEFPTNSTPNVSPSQILKFLNHTFRKRHVDIKEYFSDLHGFIETAKNIIRRPNDYHFTEPQCSRLKKHIVKAKMEMK